MGRRSLALRSLAWLAAAPFWLAPVAAGARESAPAVTYTVEPASRYDVAAGCPSREGWVAALRVRLPAALREHAAVTRFPVSIRRERGAYTGELGSANAAGDARRVRGASCAEVADALTLIAALELQELASLEAEAGARAELEASAEPTPLRSTATADATAAAEPVDAPPTAEVEPSSAGLRVGAMGFAMVQSVTTPGSGLDLGVGVTLGWQTERWQPWFLLGVYRGDAQSPLGNGVAGAGFERWAAHAVGCPLRFPRASAVSLRPCLDLDIGRLSGEGRGVSDASRSSALLASAGAELRFGWSVLERFELGAMLGGLVTLARPRFYFAPEVTSLEVAPLGVRAGASASLLF